MTFCLSFIGLHCIPFLLHHKLKQNLVEQSVRVKFSETHHSALLPVARERWFYLTIFRLLLQGVRARIKFWNDSR